MCPKPLPQATGRRRGTGPAGVNGAGKTTLLRCLLGLARPRTALFIWAPRPYTELSGGERQLTLIARALAQGAKILIMDEPVNGLDFGHQMRLLQRLEGLAASGYGVPMTTHHPDHALACASRVALLEQGRISADGPAKQVLTSEAIRRHYQVEVEVLRSSQGRAAFVPRSKPTGS